LVCKKYEKLWKIFTAFGSLWWTENFLMLSRFHDEGNIVQLTGGRQLGVNVQFSDGNWRQAIRFRANVSGRDAATGV